MCSVEKSKRFVFYLHYRVYSYHIAVTQQLKPKQQQKGEGEIKTHQTKWYEKKHDKDKPLNSKIKKKKKQTHWRCSQSFLKPFSHSLKAPGLLAPSLNFYDMQFKKNHCIHCNKKQRHKKRFEFLICKKWCKISPTRMACTKKKWASGKRERGR